ncbi:glycoside hydrolase family 12 protein [Punctularia strigosozonata HHB-11173 SS5]|uniref:glycoside hydrolase family 12 protein n=1 Tax=Punctularia strigosozonata (strain HHB-11173) TaxID=741275 RepID=UPI0004416508|nr:glycoside hydrolase family 12 protein [Punctularia strigosozonata HHB-11173 SS5]EIN10056.1 glycoside hydrolase family 12 protein [Punctularia strigosozonata HHB-11173 SS5]
MRFSVVLSLVGAALATPVLEKRLDTSTHCGQWDTVTASPYSLLLDQWGLSDATSGSDCASITSLSGTTIAWTTTFDWVGGTSVKSFTDIELTSGVNVPLSSITSAPSTWKWSISSSGTVVADVAYDLFTSATSGGSNAYEIMIWLANYNSGPISYTYSSSGSAVAIKTGVSLAGYTWSLYYGSNGSNYVYSFLPSSTITSFSGDVNLFLKYLTSNGYISSSQYLTTAQAGVEATSGSATITTSAYSLVINS